MFWDKLQFLLLHTPHPRVMSSSYFFCVIRALIILSSDIKIKRRGERGYITKVPSHEFSIKDYACLIILANLKLVKFTCKYE